MSGCPHCEDGWTWAVYGQLDTYEPCPFCNVPTEAEAEDV